MKFYSLKFTFNLSTLLLFTSSVINTIYSMKFSNTSELSKPLHKNLKSEQEFSIKLSHQNTTTTNDVNFLTTTTSEQPLIQVNGKSGLDSNAGNLAPKECYNVLKTTTGVLENDSNLDNLEKMKEYLDKGQIKSNNKFNIKGSFSLNYFFYESDDSCLFYYYTKVSRKKTFSYDRILEKMLLANATNLLKKSKANKDQNYLTNCGDTVIDNVVEGGIFLIRVKVQLNSNETKKKFESVFGKKQVDLNKIYGTIMKTFETIKFVGRVNIAQRQIGGDEKVYISTLVNDRQARCSGEAFEPLNKFPDAVKQCDYYFSKLESYINKDFRKQFEKNESDNIFTTFELNTHKIKDLNLPTQYNIK